MLTCLAHIWQMEMSGVSVLKLTKLSWPGTETDVVVTFIMFLLPVSLGLIFGDKNLLTAFN